MLIAYNQELTNRVREALSQHADVEEKKMFGKVAFMVNGKMCVSVGGDELMCRIDPEVYETAFEKAGCRKMIHGGRTMKGYVYVNENILRTKSDFDYWIKLALDFNGKVK